MRSKPRLKEKQGKEVRTSKNYGEKHGYPRLGTVIHLHKERDTETSWDTRHLPASSREAEHNCYGRKTNNHRDELCVSQGITYGCLAHSAITRSSTINKERYILNRHSKPKKCAFEFCQKCYKPPQNTKTSFSRREKNRVTYSTQPNVQTTKNIEITSSTTKREVIEVTQINTQKARLAQIELLNKLNKCKNPFIIITQEPYCYKATLALLPQFEQGTLEHQLQPATGCIWKSYQSLDIET